MRIECMPVDSGGHHTDEVYACCKARVDLRVYAIRGGTEVNKPLVGIATFTNRYRTPLFVLCTDTGQATVVGRLPGAAAGPGYVHFPDGIDAKHIAQLTAEKAIYRWSQCRSVRLWKKTRERNEAFDLNVYALAAMRILGEPFIRTLGERAARFARALPDAKLAGPAAPPQAPASRPKPSWVRG